MAKFGLGRGLADLERAASGASSNSIAILGGVERVVVRQIPLSQIGANPDQPRKTFTDSELQDLTASIKEQGVLQPIILRSVTGRPYMYEIVAGERRYRASKLAGLTEIPALVKTLTDANAMEVALIENVQRENLNPIEEGAAYKSLMEKCGYEIADVSRLIGKSESYIRNIMRLDALPESVRDSVASGKLSASHGRALVVAKDAEKLANQIIEQGLSVSDTERLVKSATRDTKRRAFESHGMPADAIRDIEKRISSALKTPAKLQEKRGGAGKIVLSFATRTQLEELVARLTGE